MKRRSIPKAIAYTDGIVVREKLPLPFVHFPGFYGTFFAFSEDESSRLKLCSCAKAPIENFFRFKLTGSDAKAFENGTLRLDSMNFPIKLVHDSRNENIDTKAQLFSWLSFEEKLCHECARAVPSYKYCHPMYGGVFLQTYGWYINKQSYEFGIRGPHILKQVCPDSILELVELDYETFSGEYEKLKNHNPSEAELLYHRFQAQEARISRAVQNEVRRKFGHKKVGQGWVSEKILVDIVRNLFPGNEVIHHFRSRALDGLELDIYVPFLSLGLEYQGIQHYQPLDHLGGADGLIRRQQLDRKKSELCKSNGIKLVYFYYDEDLSNDLVESRVKSALKSDR